MSGYQGYQFRSEDMERVVVAARRMQYNCKRKNIRGHDWRDGLGQYMKHAMKHNIDLKFGGSLQMDKCNRMYSKAGDHKENNGGEIAKVMIVNGGDLAKADAFNPITLLGVSHISDVQIESQAAIANRMGAPVDGHKRLNDEQGGEIAKEVMSHDARQLGGSDLGHYAQFQGMYQGGHDREEWLDNAPRRVSAYDEPGSNVVQNEHVQMEWLSNSKGYDPELAWAGAKMRGVPRNI
jgi:hypothetical protein